MSKSGKRLSWLGKMQIPAVFSAKLMISLFIFTTAITIALVIFIEDKSAFSEFQTSLAIVSAILFAFLYMGLYIGVELKSDVPQITDWKPLDMVDIASGVYFDPPDIDIGSGGIVETVLGCLLSIMLWVLVTIILAALGFLLINLVWGIAFTLFVVLYWVFYNALKTVFDHAVECKGKMVKSFQISVVYSFLYTGWMFALVYIINMYVY